MGYHEGLFGAGCKWEPLMQGLAAVAEFTAMPYEPEPEQVNWDIEVFEHSRGTAIVDNRFWLTRDYPDLLVELSGKLAITIAAFYAETTSGSYGLLVAKSGKLRRFTIGAIRPRAGS